MVILVIIFLSFILSLSFLKEIPVISKELDRFPVLMSFISSWSFFAPTPGMLDYHLLYRGINEQEEVQDWEGVFSIKEKRSPCAVIWNPEKKYLKTLVDMVQELIKFSFSSNEEKQICLSIPYLHILNFTTSLKHDKPIKKVQFLILGGSRLNEYKVEFVSSVHPIPDK
jgi:hypothetical protein